MRSLAMISPLSLPATIIDDALIWAVTTALSPIIETVLCADLPVYLSVDLRRPFELEFAAYLRALVQIGAGAHRLSVGALVRHGYPASIGSGRWRHRDGLRRQRLRHYHRWIRSSLLLNLVVEKAHNHPSPKDLWRTVHALPGLYFALAIPFVRE